MLGPWWQVSIVAIVSSIIFLVLDPSFPGSTPFWFMLLITWFSWLNRWVYISVLDCHLLPLAFPLVTTSSISTPSIMQGVRLSPSHTHKIKKKHLPPCDWGQGGAVRGRGSFWLGPLSSLSSGSYNSHISFEFSSYNTTAFTEHKSWGSISPVKHGFSYASMWYLSYNTITSTHGQLRGPGLKWRATVVATEKLKSIPSWGWGIAGVILGALGWGPF